MAGVVALVCLVAIGWKIAESDNYLWATSGSQEPFYFSVAQVLINSQDVQQKLALKATGAKVSPESLARSMDILISRVHFIVDDNELRARFYRIETFGETAKTWRTFVDTVLPPLYDKTLSPAAALAAVSQFDLFDQSVADFGNVAWRKDNEEREERLKHIGRQRLAVGAIGALLLIALISVSRLLLRNRRISREREKAIDAERAAVQAKIKFLGMVSHELRSPLQSIVSALDVLDGEGTPIERAIIMKRIRRSATELTVQLRDMLTLARGQAGRFELSPEVFEACELVRGTVEDFEKKAKDKGLSVKVSLPDEPLFIVADSVRIGQVMHNLVGNAVHYTNDGDVSVRMSLAVGAQPCLLLHIADTGPGLPVLVQNTLRSVDDNLASVGGLRRGIGLAVVRTLLAQLGGEFVDWSTGSCGTTFSLRIPIAMAGERPPSQSQSGDRILVVDDREDLLTGFAQVCAQLEFECDTASSTAMALNLMEAHIYSVVLIDLDMPTMTGVELAMRVKSSKLNSRARLIAMSAGGGPGNEHLAKFDMALEKPVSVAQMAALMGS